MSYEAEGHNFLPYVMCPADGTDGWGAPTFNNTVWLNLYCLMNGLNQRAEIQVPLKAGRWHIELLMTQGNASGDLTCYLDSADLGVQQGYSATNQNAVMEWTTAVTPSGVYTVRLEITGKQAESSGYSIAASMLVLRRDAESEIEPL